MEKIKEIVRIKQEIKRGKSWLDNYKITSPKEAARLITKLIGEDDREVLLVVVLSTKNQVNAVHRAHVGSINASIVHPRECFKSAILNNGASIMIAHNHPSGDPTPSEEDKLVSKRVAEAGKILGIDLLDSLIVTDDENRFVSLKEKGYL